jgi:predicted transcriptional regulator
MKVLSDAKSLIMFQIIAASSPGGLRTTELNRDLQITLKQLYMRISNLVNAGLARRQGGRYFLTSYGKLMVASLEIMNKASSNFEKLVAIDSMEASNIANNMPEEERRKIVEILISNQQIKEILLLQRGKSQSSLDDDRPLSVIGPPEQDTERKEVQILALFIYIVNLTPNENVHCTVLPCSCLIELLYAFSGGCSCF